jgi:uncharacterized protein Yka (UPF0111/DUF47 family)
MLRWFRAFLPREERFFDLFARHSQAVAQGALALQEMLRGGDETTVHCQRVNQFENDADNITREVLTAVRRTFITPFDRVDIKNLITAMDDAIDQRRWCCSRFAFSNRRCAKSACCWSNAPIWSAVRCR